MDSFLMFLNINCHKQRLFPEIGVGVIPIVVSPVNTKNGAMEFLCYKAHAMVDIWTFQDNFINYFQCGTNQIL